MIYDYSFRNRLILCKEETFIISLKFKTGNEKPKTVPQKHETQDTHRNSAVYNTAPWSSTLVWHIQHSMFTPQHTHAACACARKHTEMQHPSLPTCIT